MKPTGRGRDNGARNVLGVALVVVSLTACGADTGSSPVPVDGPSSSFVFVPLPTGRTSTPIPRDTEGGRGVPSSSASREPVLDGPIAAAREWLVRYRSVSWTDSAPSAWVDRIRPVVTDRLAAEYEPFRQGGAARWSDFVERRCATTAEEVDGTVPREAPATESAVSVLVNGRVVTRCERRKDVVEEFSAVVEVVRAPDGVWRVDQRDW
ncbi:hypothetical protein EHYA_04643 [Embleya hyalina]|uniref:Lipoprotein n=2 Tax=Embleya hyalina TaxID=516124 RepID=A0A401YQT0_9ACTN|nr:hypothetical protein EHYA_04643 [Embleya hyalina]